MTKKALSKANKEATELFAAETATLTAKYKSLVTDGIKKGYHERHCRRLAIEEIRKIQAGTLYVNGLADRKNDLLIMLYTQYSEMIIDWFGTYQVRVAEWYAEGWPVFLQRHYINNREVDEGCQTVAGWSFDSVGKFLAIQHAHRQVESLHEQQIVTLSKLAAPGLSESQSAMNNAVPMGNTSNVQTSSAPGTIDNAQVGIDDRLLAVMLFRIMLHVGFVSTEINDSRLGRLIAYLRKDNSEQCQESCRKAVNHARKLFDLAEEGTGQKHLNQMNKLKLWLQHFTNGGPASDFEFIAYLEDEIAEIENQMT